MGNERQNGTEFIQEALSVTVEMFCIKKEIVVDKRVNAIIRVMKIINERQDKLESKFSEFEIKLYHPRKYLNTLTTTGLFFRPIEILKTDGIRHT